MSKKKKRQPAAQPEQKPCYLDLDKAFHVIDASQESEADKELDKKLLAALAPYVDGKGHTGMYDEDRGVLNKFAIPRRFLSDTPNPNTARISLSVALNGLGVTE